MKRHKILILLFLLFALAVVGCDDSQPNSNTNGTGYVQSGPSTPQSLQIEATSAVRRLEEAGIFQDFTARTGVPVTLRYFGDVELMLKINSYSQSAPTNVHAMWLGSPVYAPGRLLQEKTSIMRTYIVLGVAPDTAQKLGWSTGTPLTMAQVISAVQSGNLALAVPSASQDDAGANFLLAAIQSYVNTPHITSEMLQDPNLLTWLKTFYQGVVGSANNAAALSDLFIEDQAAVKKFNGFILPESLALRTNLELENRQLTPANIYYVEDAVGVQDFPLGWIQGISETKQQEVKSLVEYLREPEVQAKIQQAGYFRTNPVGMTIDNPDANIFRSNWGIITDQNFLPSPLPKDNVIIDALRLYQTTYKRPSDTAWCLDYSGSMNGAGESQRNEAMSIILNQAKASTYLLEMGPSDTARVLPFSDSVGGVGTIVGNDPTSSLNLLNQLIAFRDGGGTNIYGCVMYALDELQRQTNPDTLPAVIVLTDGMHNGGTSFRNLKDYYTEAGLTIPIYSIMLGEAQKGDLESLAQLSNGRICDGRQGEEALIQCFKDFRGSN